MKTKYIFDWRQFGRAVVLLILGVILNLVPLAYEWMCSKYEPTADYTGFFPWISINPEYYFLLLSTVFTSFIEYIITAKSNFISSILINSIFVIATSGVWAMATLKNDILKAFVSDMKSEWLVISCLVYAVILCLGNLIIMNTKTENVGRQYYKNKRVF